MTNPTAVDGPSATVPIRCPDDVACSNRCDRNGGRCQRVIMGDPPFYPPPPWPDEVVREHAPRWCEDWTPHTPHGPCPGVVLICDVTGVPLPDRYQRHNQLWQSLFAYFDQSWLLNRALPDPRNVAMLDDLARLVAALPHGE